MKVHVLLAFHEGDVIKVEVFDDFAERLIKYHEAKSEFPTKRYTVNLIEDSQ
jgi:hypothetical protein